MKRRLLPIALLGLIVIGCSQPNNSSNKYTEIEVKTNPTKLEYKVGDYFDPTGLEIAAHTSKAVEVVSYEYNKDRFTFTPSLTTPLTIDDTTIKITYNKISTNLAITVANLSSVELDFTVTQEKVDGIPTTGDSSGPNFLSTLNKYYFEKNDVKLSSISGGFIQIQKGFDITPTRNVGQLLNLGSRSSDVDFTFNFVDTIKTITFVFEPYCKYVAYNTTYNVDYDTYLNVNGTKIDIAAHSQEDKDETKTVKFNVNSKSINLKCPNTASSGDTKANRIMVYKILLEY